MSIQAIWDNEEKTIVRHIYEGKWTLEDYYGLIDAHRAMLKDLDYEVDIINDLRSAGLAPSNMASAIKYAARNAPRNEGINVMVGANHYVKALIDLVNRTAGVDITEVRHVTRLEDAYAMIADYRVTTARR